MIKSELIQQITENNPHLYHRDVERIINMVFNQIITALRNGDRVELRGFGVFAVKSRKSRLGRNPRTGSAVKVEGSASRFLEPARRCANGSTRRNSDAARTGDYKK